MALKRVDDTSRAISAFFNEIQGVAAKAPSAAWAILPRSPHSAAAASAAGTAPVKEDRPEGVSLEQFCHFLSHYRVLSIDFDHGKALEVFLSASDQEGHDGHALLDVQGFRNALTGVARGLQKDLASRRQSVVSGTGGPEENALSSHRKGDALEDLLHEINLRRDATLDHEAAALLAPLYDAEVIQAVYFYGSALRGLFHHFCTSSGGEALVDSQSTTPSSQSTAGRRPSVAGGGGLHRAKEPPTVNCRSLFRLATATRLVPHCIVGGEMADIVASRCRIRERGSLMPHERAERHAERRYLEEGRMFGTGEEQNFTIAARGQIPGEPRYSFPDIVEFLTAAAFCVPPRPHEESTEVRVARIHDVFGGCLGLPQGIPAALDDGLSQAATVQEAFGARAFLEEVARLHEDDDADGGGSRPRPLADAKPPTDLRDILVRLAQELPALPEKKDPHMPEPPPAKVENLKPQPPTVDELLRLPPGQRVEKAAGPKKKGRKKKGAAKAKRHIGPVKYNEVIFYAKRPVQKMPEIPPQWPTDRRARGLEQMDLRLLEKSQQAQRLAAPEGGGLRMSFIDEPLRAPRCKHSEEVATLMETALAARRLRHYEESIALLIRARRLWAALEAGREVPTDWADIHPLVAAPSPWGDGPVSVAGRAQRSESGDCSGSCRQPQSGNACETSESVLKGTGVFSRFSATCAASHVLRRTSGATAALAAAASQAGAGRANAASPDPARGMSLDQTILPSDMRPEGPASARGATRSFRPGTAGSPASARVPAPAAAPMQHARTEPAGGETPRASAPLVPHPPRVPRTATRGGSFVASRPASAASGCTTAIAAATAACLEADEVAEEVARRYEPQRDFQMAFGDGESDLVKLPPEAAIFFLCELASLHSAVREDDLAAQLLWRARAPTERLPTNHPDTAVMWCGIGRVAYLAGAFDVAARATAKGRKIRERALGGDTVETATSYNNLACCLFALDRPMEALAYSELAEEILRVLAGEDHPRSQTALRNLEKARSAQKHLHCQVPYLFSYYVKDIKLKGGKKKKKKKGSRGSSRGSTSGKSKGSRKSSAGSSKSSKSKGKRK